MGKTEKIVVLSVLLAVVLLFVWSLQGDGKSVAASGGDADANRTAADQKAEPANRTAERGKTPRPGSSAGTAEQREAQRRRAGSARPDVDRGQSSRVAAKDAGIELVPKESSLLFAELGPKEGQSKTLNANQTGTSPATPDRGRVNTLRVQPGWDLVTTVGLEATLDPELMILRPAAGSTWEGLARDLYGSETKAGLLKRNNEGMRTPGARIFVPATDDLGDQADLFIVEVLPGESLWGVASRTLKKGSRWREIYEANLDVISDPDLVAPGTRLRIPR